MRKNEFNGKLDMFMDHLREEEKSRLTIEKYQRDIRLFHTFLGGKPLDKQMVIAYKSELIERYKPASVNSMLAALKSFFLFCGWTHLNVKSLKIQQSAFAAPEKDINRAEYNRLLAAAKSQRNERLYLLMQTICATGIRVSELQFITMEAVKAGRADVASKGKRRPVFITTKLKNLLKAYAKQRGIESGSIFISRSGKPLSRHRIWADMKALCKEANVEPSKVFPHNLRHLFAKSFYAIEKDLCKLADLLGHSSIDTTRIYTRECGREHLRLLRKIPLLI